MIQPVKKVIRASAGTGKTYRLSLEYIGLLLKFRQHGLHFSEILVITFTKKATAEIRERIFSHLDHIIQGDETGQELRKNLQSFFDLKIGDNDITALREIYVDMLTNKHQVQISTIDSFTNTIFKTIIAPYLGITDYTVKPNIEDDVREELYRTLLQTDSTREQFRNFFERSQLKTIQHYDNFINSVIRHRWAFRLIRSTSGTRKLDALTDELLVLWETVQTAFGEFCREFQTYVKTEHPTKSAKDVLLSDVYSLLDSVFPNPQLGDIQKAFERIYCNEELLAQHYTLLLEDKRTLWNGSKLLRKKAEAARKEQLLDLLQTSRLAVANFMFARFLLQEEDELFQIIEHILARYDELKFRDKVFTHDDISYYTFKYLYDPELSLLEGDVVSNSFYEYLSTHTRFVLIDEFQDTSIIQYKILLPMIQEVISGVGVKEYGGTIVVGDEKQSIYGWRGGERDLLLNMPVVMQQADELTLDTSYRSDEEIIRFINEVFGHASLHEQLWERDIEWPYTPITANKANGAGHVQLFLRNLSQGKDSSNTISTAEEAIREFLNHTLSSPAFGKSLRAGKTAILARRNADLDAFAAALDERGIRYVQESANSILDFRAIKPVLFLLNYLAYGDFFDVLRFLRSDLVLLDTETLKELLLTYRDAKNDSVETQTILQSCAQVPEVKRCSSLLERLEHEDDLFDRVKLIAETYNITGLFDTESDIKNLNQFFRIISEFKTSNLDYPKSLKGFLDYCDEERDSETFKQANLEDVNAITLMTIHKAKGLEFDTVFLYWNVSGGGGRPYREVRPYLHYAPGYRDVEDYVLTFNYDNIIAQSSFHHFTDQVKRREDIEELNNFYVALTRAKSNLFMCFVYTKSGGFDEMIKKTDELSMARLVIGHIRGLFRASDQLFQYSLDREHGERGQISAAAEVPESTPEDDVSFLHDYVNSDRKHMLEMDKERLEMESHVDLKTVFLEQKAIEIGNVVHYYLSFIKRGTPQEREFARAKTRSFYGTLLSPATIDSILPQVDEFIQNHPALFSPNWTHIYTEYTLFDEQGREQRIDRLMVDEPNKRIDIVDYKTGHVFEPEQVDLYIKTIQSLGIVREHGYTVQGRFLEITIQ